MHHLADILSFSVFDNDRETILFGVFGIVIILFLILDLGFFNKGAHRITTKSALYQSIFWVMISVGYGILILFFDDPSGELSEENTVAYFSAYLTEKALSIDNIFVILLILKYFNVDEIHYHRILFWGIIGAVVFRAVFIFVGAYLIHQFHFILYIFGVFLIYSGIRIYFEDGDEQIHPEKNPILNFCKKYLPLTTDDRGGHFMIKEGGKWMFTPLFLVIVLIETTDLIFAVDSIPAAFAITTNEFLIYTSNIFAVMGLRAMFFLLAGIIDRFYLLQKGLSIILFFIGAKMMLEIFDLKIDVFASFAVIIATLFLSIVLSVVVPRKSKE